MKSVREESSILGEISLPSVRESVARARSEVRGWLGEGHPAIDDVVLAVSELTTNAIVHSNSRPGDLIRLTLAATEEIVYLEVSDPGSMFSGPHVRKEPDAEDGRGLLIVREISAERGTREHGRGRGRTVWCVIRADLGDSGPPILDPHSGREGGYSPR
ncbi:ATP-binding protein [Planomonospora sp. ID82291]|uniref:ATP-binding protein n=1 Tax=Planomonospora sp. ID82291 TaxID=2738136 RepID=UPI0018C414F8|nr:ATP-binding protein [Planomonospora sp. ID82291]MBG0816014.1 ATP-binding protein [Planomonospora sp. ID82291]